MKFPVKNSIKKLVLVFCVLYSINSFSQYSPFWLDQRLKEDSTHYTDYWSVIDTYNQDRCIETTIDNLDSLAIKSFNEGYYEKFLFLKNEASNFCSFAGRFDEGYALLHDAMQLFSEKQDTLNVEYVASQRLLRVLLRRSSYESRGENELFESQLYILEKMDIRGEPLRNTLVDYGMFLMRQGETSKAIDILFEARTDALKENDLASMAIADYTIITNLPPIYDLQETTFAVLKNDIALFEEAEQSIPMLSYRTYFNYLLGHRYYSYFENVDKGIYYTKKAIENINNLPNPLNNLLASCHSNLALMYSDLGDTTLLWKHYEKAKYVADTRPMSDYNKSLAYVNITDAVVSVSADSAFVLLDSIKRQPGAQFFSDKITEIEVKALLKKDDKEEAIKLIAEKFDEFEKIDRYSIPLISDSIDYLNQVRFFELLGEAYSASDIFYVEDVRHDILSNLISKKNRLYLEVMKNDIYGHELSSLVNKYYNFLMPSLVYLLSLENSEKYQPEILQLVFSSKALQLRSNLLKSRLQSQMETNTSLFSQLMAVTDDIQNVRNDLADNSISEQKERELKVDLNSLLVDNLMLRYRILEKDEFEIDMPEIPSLAQVQHKLNPGEGILEYNINDTTLIWTLITESFAKTGINYISDLSERVSAEIHAIRTGRQSTDLGSILLSDIEDEIRNLKHLIVIPDKELNMIPFEWLTLSGTEGMLIENLKVSYNYSISLWYFLRDSDYTNYVQSIMAVAPLFYDSNDKVHKDFKYVTYYRGLQHLSPLYHSQEEVIMIESIFSKNNIDVLNLVGPDANLYNTRKHIGQYDIIHLATHGHSNVDYPERSGIFLYPESFDETEIIRNNNFLSLGELLNMDLRAQLVVLSACDTGTGSIVDGEGVMALPRGFIFAGVPNVIASLWKVNDERTKEFMTAFYIHLLDGNSYSQALRLAKLDCIEKGFLPLDWAGFVLIGS